MRFRAGLIVLFIVGYLTAVRSPVSATDTTRGGTRDDERAIRAAGDAYLEAMQQGDTEAMTEIWTADADYVDAAGQTFKAREVIAEAGKRDPARPRPEIKIASTSIRFLTPDVAIEDGITEVVPPDGKGPAKVRGRFTAIWVKENEKWLLSSLRDARLERHANPEQLKQLDWMVGEWTGDHDGKAVRVHTQWNPTHTFLQRELQVTADGKTVFSGTQRVGWDAATKSIRSWNFDSDGGHGEGVWTQHDTSWIADTVRIGPDGQRSSSRSIYTPEGPNKFVWTSGSTNAQNNQTPDVEVTLTRKPVAPSAAKR